MSHREQSALDFAKEIDALAGHELDGHGEFMKAEIVPLMEANVQENFSGSHTAAGLAWPPRKDPRLKHPLLILSGALQAGAVGPSQDHIERITDDSLEFGVGGLPYVAVHQYGWPEKNIAQREYMAVGDATIEKMAEAEAAFRLKKHTGA